MKTKPGLEDQYAHYAKINSEDDYSKACVDAGESIGNALDDGATAEEALKAMNGQGLTGNMAAMAAKAVAHFHPRGEEIREEWNNQWGGKGLKKGIVNPAILNISDDGKMTPEVEPV